jgi:hypothetical protein
VAYIAAAVLRDMTPHSQVDGYHHLEESAASIFRADDFSDMLVTMYKITWHHTPAERTLKRVSVNLPII